MRSLIQVIWINSDEVGRWSQQDSLTAYDMIEKQLEKACHKVEFERFARPLVDTSFNEVNSQRELMEFLDSQTLDCPEQALETIFWVLSPKTDKIGRSIEDPATRVVASLITRYPLSWIVFHFRDERPTDSTGVCESWSAWHKVRGINDAASSSVFAIVDLFIRGFRLWFDPSGYRSSMLDLLRNSENGSISCNGVDNEFHSRRKHVSVALDDESGFSLSAAYALYRAGLGSIAVSRAELFGIDSKSETSSLAEILEMLLSSRGERKLIVLRDIELLLTGSLANSSFAKLDDWPLPLSSLFKEARSKDSDRIFVRIATAGNDLIASPEQNWYGPDFRMGESYDGLSVSYRGIRKPLASLIFSEPNKIREAVPFFEELTGTMDFSISGSSDKIKKRHSPPRELQGHIEFFQSLRDKISENPNFRNGIFASLVELNRFEALRGSGPLLVVDSLERLSLLEVSSEISSPYFESDPDVSPRVEEVLSVVRRVVPNDRRDLRRHSIREIFGRLKVLYQSNGIFKAANEMQLQLHLQSASSVLDGLHQIRFWVWKHFPSARPPNADKATTATFLFSSFIRVLMKCFIHPFGCLLLWIILNASVFLVAWVLGGFQKYDSVKFTYMIFTGNLPNGVEVSQASLFVIVLNVLGLAIFTASVFRWITRD